MAKHILAATDGSPLADKALVYAVDLAKKLQAKVTVVTVSESWSPLEIASKVEAGHMHAVEEFEKHASTHAKKVLDHAQDVARKNGVSVETLHVKDARPADGILQAVQSVGADLIVMASHGRRGLSKLLLGSQAQEVLSLAKVPVLIHK